tara:strand:- start:733 stop:966 length:234 start_codon:yes stop_codon:yes gene_type:complete
MRGNFHKDDAITGKELMGLEAASLVGEGRWSNHCRFIKGVTGRLTNGWGATLKHYTLLEVRNPEDHKQTIIVAAWTQ